jgi:hypothetical protein
VDLLTKTNKQLNKDKLAAEKNLQECNEIRNKTNTIKGKYDEKGIEMTTFSKKRGGKSRKSRKPRKSKQTRRVYI